MPDQKNFTDIPFHYYKDAAENIQQQRGDSLLSLDPQFPFAITQFELMNASAQAEYPHRHDCFEILYICEGEGTHIIDFEPYPIQAPVFYFLAKDQVHFWQLTKPLKGYALLFPEEFMSLPSNSVVRVQDLALFQQVEDSPYLVLEQENLTMVNGIIEGMEQEFSNDADCSVSVLRAYLHILLTKLHRLYILNSTDQYSAKTSSLVRQFRQLVAEHFIEEHAVKDYANRIGISTSHLTDTVKAVTGFAPGHLIRQKLVLEAKRLLAHSNVTVAEIGYRLNFEDSSYFGRFFKRETGMSPAAFRKQTREQYQITSK